MRFVLPPLLPLLSYVHVIAAIVTDVFQSERWLSEASTLLNNTNAQALSSRDQKHITELQLKLADFKQASVPAQKDRVNNMVTLSIQLYGELL